MIINEEPYVSLCLSCTRAMPGTNYPCKFSAPRETIECIGSCWGAYPCPNCKRETKPGGNFVSCGEYVRINYMIVQDILDRLKDEDPETPVIIAIPDVYRVCGRIPDFISTSFYVPDDSNSGAVFSEENEIGIKDVNRAEEAVVIWLR